MTVSTGSQVIEVLQDNKNIANIKAALVVTDPKVLCHIVDRLRSAGNAAFKSRDYAGNSCEQCLSFQCCFRPQPVSRAKACCRIHKFVHKCQWTTSHYV